MNKKIKRPLENFKPLTEAICMITYHYVKCIVIFPVFFLTWYFLYANFGLIGAFVGWLPACILAAAVAAGWPAFLGLSLLMLLDAYFKTGGFWPIPMLHNL